MRKLYLSILSIGLGLTAFSQSVFKNPQTNEIKICGQYEALQRMQQEDPARYQQYLEARALTQEETHYSQEKSGVVYTIPVVFHILHNGGSENISEAQVLDAVRILNRDFRKQNADVNNVVSQFQSIAGDAEIEFALAKVAPNGACFNGITRTQHSSSANGANGQTQVNAIVAGNDVYQGVWPHNKYLNIYVCKSLIDGAAGYTFLPQGNASANATNMYYNGIFMLHDYVGSIGTASEYKSRALTHEVGHWLNLHHVWGSGNIGTCGTDYVADTPQTNGSNGVCNLSKVTCDGNLDNVENYMDYSYCSKMFTNGQITRMRNAITSNTAGRNNIWTTANLQAVGVLPGANLCSADVEASSVGVCAGGSVTFSVTGTTATINSYNWTFAGGSPSSSNAASPTVTYNTPGTYTVTVAITSSVGNRTITKTNYITVSAPPTNIVNLPLTEGFVGTTFPPSNWSITNGGTSNTWARYNNGTAPTTTGSARINYYSSNNPGEIDDLNTPTLNMNGYSSASLTFDVAYRPYTGQSDKLEVLVSPGCGMPYEVVYSKSGTQLMTENSTNTSAYNTPSTWRNESVDLSPYVGNGQVSVKFRGTNGYSNYLYIDNINISGVSSGPNANFNASSTSACTGQTVTFTNTSTQATSYSWNFGAGATPATANTAGPHTVTYSTSGAKTVTLTINGGASTTTQTININSVPATPTVSVQNNCGNAVITASGGTSYQWSTGATGSSITVTNSNPVTVTSSNNGCLSSPATANPSPKQVPTVTMGSIPSMCVYHSPVNLNQGSPAGGTYSGVGVSGNTFNPATAGTGSKTITYSYTAANGCTGTATTQVLVDGCVGIEETEANTFSVSPNPSNGDVWVRSSSVINEVIVLDNAGRVIQVVPGNQATEIQLDLKALSAGSYFIHSKMEESSKMVKLIIQ